MHLQVGNQVGVARRAGSFTSVLTCSRNCSRYNGRKVRLSLHRDQPREERIKSGFREIVLYDHLYHRLECIRNRGVERCNVCWIDIEGSCVSHRRRNSYSLPGAYRIVECPRSPYDSVVTLV